MLTNPMILQFEFCNVTLLYSVRLSTVAIIDPHLRRCEFHPRSSPCYRCFVVETLHENLLLFMLLSAY